MTRLEALKLKCTQYPYEKSVKRLTESEFDRIVEFIEEHDELGHLEFEYAVNRMYLNVPKPKNWLIIQEMLVVVNSAVHVRCHRDR